MTEALKISDQKTQVRITLFALYSTLIYIFQYESMLLSPGSSSCHCKQNVIRFYYILVYSTLIYSILLSFHSFFHSFFLSSFLSSFLLSFFLNLSHFISFHCLINSSGWIFISKTSRNRFELREKKNAKDAWRCSIPGDG